MKVQVEVVGSVEEPYLEIHQGHEIGMLLRPGFMDVGSKRSTVERIWFEAGEMGLCTPHLERWIGSVEMEHLILGISDAALTAALDGAGGVLELPPQRKFVDSRVAPLVTAVNAERAAGFPSGRLFLDSVEQAIAVALVNRYAGRRLSPRIYRGGLTPARLRRVTELVKAKIEEDLTLEEMAESVELSKAHFSQMFRKSTGQSPHQFVLRHRVEHAKQILRAPNLRVLDVAVACGFKTQQHFARVFRKMCGISPTEYRQEFQH